MLVLSRRDVEELLDVDRLVDALAGAMADLSTGRASMPGRGAATIAERSAMLATMPAFLPSAGALMAKVVTVFPENHDRPTHQAIVCCFDPDDGSPIAIMDGTYLTASRTAAGSTLATRLLARPDAEVASIIGTGVQARAHALALSRCGGVKAVRVAGRDDAKVRSLVDDLNGVGIPAAAAPSIEEAVRSADVVCATTHADRPVVRREWLRPGTHLNSVGYNTAGDGEIDTDTIRDALVVVESRLAALAPPPAGAVELHRAIGRGAITAADVHTEVGELVVGTAKGRVDEHQLTLYKSVGVAVQDAAAAALVLGAADQREIGQRVSL